jgi:hypothetical protein
MNPFDAARDAILLAQANIDESRARGHAVTCSQVAQLRRAQDAWKALTYRETPKARKARELRWYGSSRTR